MAEVVKFPRNEKMLRADAELYIRTEMRMQLAAACGVLTKEPSISDLNEVIDRMTNVAAQIDCLLALRKACEL